MKITIPTINNLFLDVKAYGLINAKSQDCALSYSYSYYFYFIYEGSHYA